LLIEICMLKNYIKIAWRNLSKNRTFSIINITGLSLSVAFCLLLFFYIRKEQSYDNFPENKDRLFRFESTNTWPGSNDKPTTNLFSFLTKDDDINNNLVTPLVIGRDIQRNFPEVKSITRFADQGTGLVRINKTVYKLSHYLYAEDNFFKNFSFPIIKGNSGALKTSKNNIVISENTAKKYFGSTDPIGKIVELLGDSTYLFTVAAVAKDAPENSSIQFDAVLPLQADPGYEENIKGGFNQSSHLLVIELKEGVSASRFSEKLNRWSKKYYVEPYVAAYGQYLKNVDFSNFRWYLRPFADCHYNVSSPWGHYTNTKNIYQLVCLVFIILVIASLNYVLLAVTNAASRSQEVGIRKVMGANRRSVILQFWVETQIIVMVSVLAGFVLTILLIPLFDSVIGTDLKFHDLRWRDVIPGILCLCFILGVLAGYYPALITSKMKPISILKSFRTFKINPYFSRVLVVLQYTGSVILMISAFIINRQMHYIREKDLGFDKEQVVMVSNPVWNPDFTKNLKARLGNFAASQPYISHFSGMSGGLDGSYNTNGFVLNGEQKWRKQLSVDYGFFEMLGIKFTQGRPFSRVISSDTARIKPPAVINETLFNMLGDKVRLGEYCAPLRATVIGVVQDYHFETLSKKIEPEEHVLAGDFEMVFMFKLKPGHVQEGISAIGKEWKSLTDFPFEYSFLDETISKMYDSDLHSEKTIRFSCLFAIFIACLGLFGLSAINAVNRTKEIGIRKVLGASVKNIAVTLSSGFAFMVLLAILIATPISYWIMDKWLEDFSYRIDLQW
jgi:putative ABC transport system permease protein